MIDTQGILDATDLLNDLNRAIATKPRALDCVVTAASLLLATALRQIGGTHGQERARLIAKELQRMVRTAGESEHDLLDELLMKAPKMPNQ